MKNLVKVMDHDGKTFQYLQLNFPQISESKINEGIFVGPPIRHRMMDKLLGIF
jgi:hypothetical protein